MTQSTNQLGYLIILSTPLSSVMSAGSCQTPSQAGQHILLDVRRFSFPSACSVARMSPGASSTPLTGDESAQNASDVPSLASRLYRQVDYSVKKTWQDRGDIIRHSKELFTVGADLTCITQWTYSHYNPL